MTLADAPLLSTQPWLVGALAVGAGTVCAAIWLGMRARSTAHLAARRAAAEHARNAEIAAMTRGLAHEIKNPLSTVGLNAQLLREEILDSSLPDQDRERIMRRVDALARETSRLGDVLNDFLRYAGRLQLDARWTDVRDVVRELADFFAPQAEQASVELKLELPAAPLQAHVDPSLMKQVLLNLLLNAVQAMQRNPAGQARVLSVAASQVEERHRKGAHGVRLRVADTGPGVPAELRDQIFEPYVSNRPGGNGLGLAAARRIVEAHGGRIQLVDDPAGAVFEIFLPAAGTTPASPSA